MIKIGDDYKIDADKFQFILATKTIGSDKEGNAKDRWAKTFHANIAQVSRAIAETELKNGLKNDLLGIEELKQSFELAVDRLCLAVSQIKDAGNE